MHKVCIICSSISHLYHKPDREEDVISGVNSRSELLLVRYELRERLRRDAILPYHRVVLLVRYELRERLRRDAISPSQEGAISLGQSAPQMSVTVPENAISPTQEGAISPGQYVPQSA